MGTANRTARREQHSARWTALVGAVCALTLTVLAGVCAPSARPIEHLDGRWVPITSGAARKGSVSADLPGRQEQLVGVHKPSAQARLELPRPTRQPLTPHNKRFDPRQELAPGPEARLAVGPASALGDGVSTSHGRIADRPLVVNCPAQGPPRTA